MLQTFQGSMVLFIELSSNRDCLVPNEGDHVINLPIKLIINVFDIRRIKVPMP